MTHLAPCLPSECLPAPAWRVWPRLGRLGLVLVLLLCALGLGGLSGCSKKPKVEPVVASVEATPAQLAEMVADVTKRKGAEIHFARQLAASEPFVARLKNGAHVLRFRVDGELAQAGRVDAVFSSTVGEDASGGRVMLCIPGAREYAAGPVQLVCDSPPFRVEQDKTVVVAIGLGRAQGFRVTRLAAEVVVVPVEVGARGWLSALMYPLGGLVMLVLWFVFFRR